MDAGALRLLVVDGRPQADRDPLHRHQPDLLPRGRRHGALDPDATRAAGHGRRDQGLVQRTLHDARHDDDLPGRRPDLRRLRQLPRAPDDRSARRCLPASERAFLLALPVRRRRAARQLLCRRRSREGGLDRLSAAVDRRHRQRPGPLDSRPPHPLALVACGGDQLPRDDPQHAHCGDDLDAAAALRLGDRELRGAPRRRPAGVVGGPDHAPARPAGVDALLHPRRGRERGALPARLLVLRAPGGLRDDPARDGDRLRGDPRLRAEADLRLHGDRFLDRRDRVLLPTRVGPPHVHGRPAGRTPGLVHARFADDRRPDRREDLQLAGDDLARQPDLRHGDALGPRLRRGVHDRRAVRDLRCRLPVRLAGPRHLLRGPPPALCALRRVGLWDLCRPLLLVAEALRPVPEREARQVALLAHLHRLQPRLLPTALPRAARHAATRLHLSRRRRVGHVQPDLHDRLLRHGPRDPRVHRQRLVGAAPQPAGGERPLAGRHARVVHDLAAAAAQFRQAAVRDQRPPAPRPPPPPPGETLMSAGPWLRLCGIAAAAAIALVVASGEHGIAHRVLVVIALPFLAALVLGAWFAHRRVIPAASSLVLFLAAVATWWSPRLHLALAGGALAATVIATVPLYRGARPGPVAWRDYVALTKPRIMTLLLLTGAAGMFVGAQGVPDLGLLAATIVGLGLACGGASALNHVLDRDIDRSMGRTSARPVAGGRVSAELALEFGLALSALSFVLLASVVNVLAAVLALVGNLFYVLVYTRWLKRSTPQNIVIGGAAGAVPPLVGWAAATGNLTVPALFLFLVVFFWTPPHFWALALLIRRDYAEAGVPMLPVVRGERETARSIVRYSVVLVAITLLPVFWRTLGAVYLGAAVALGLAFLWLAFALAHETTPARARRLFSYSLAYLALLFVAMAIDPMVL